MDCFQLLSFQTELGWLGLLINQDLIYRLKFGFSKEIELLKSFDEYFDVRTAAGREKQWVDSLKKYAAGDSIDLEGIPVNFLGYSKFQTTVLKRCRAIPYGSTVSYGELAVRAERPRAARAVGTAMKQNRYPLIIPCHRVVAASGIGGYSASSGISVKRRLLELEGVQIPETKKRC